MYPGRPTLVVPRTPETIEFLKETVDFGLRERSPLRPGSPAGLGRSGEVPRVAFGVRNGSFLSQKLVSKGSNRLLKVLQRPRLCLKNAITMNMKMKNKDEDEHEHEREYEDENEDEDEDEHE